MKRVCLCLLGTALGLPLVILGQSAAAPQITGLTLSGQTALLTWTPASQGQAFTVQYRDLLSDGVWLNGWGSQPWPIAVSQWADLEPPQGRLRFYRVLAVPAAQRGKLLASTTTTSLSLFELTLLLVAQGIPVTPQYGVKVYKLVYETVDPFGGRTVASGALAVPENPGKASPLLSYQHGTLTQKTEAPSANLYGETLIGIVMACTGYVSALPDYLGLGDSPGLHPYHHARSEASAAVDMLRAARVFCANSKIQLNGQLFLCGYSQGGHATMALHRELEHYHADEFPITACAPMAGAYDLSGVTSDSILADQPTPSPYYFAYLLAAYREAYQLTGSWSDWLAAPYDTTLPPLLRGYSSGGEINAAMPPAPISILKPAVLAAFKSNPRHPLRLALRDNDLYRWTPRAPLRLYHCRADRDVIFANSTVARDSFLSRGATQVELIDPLPIGDHGACTVPSFLLAKAWFDTLKN
jgi:hypothetical protein